LQNSILEINVKPTLDVYWKCTIGKNGAQSSEECRICALTAEELGAALLLNRDTFQLLEKADVSMKVLLISLDIKHFCEALINICAVKEY